MERNDIEERKGKDAGDRIKKLVEEKIEAFMKCDPEEVEKDTFYMMATQVKIGATYDRDQAVMKRINAGQTIRVVTLIASNTEERKAYLEATRILPELPVSDLQGK